MSAMVRRRSERTGKRISPVVNRVDPTGTIAPAIGSAGIGTPRKTTMPIQSPFIWTKFAGETLGKIAQAT